MSKQLPNGSGYFESKKGSWWVVIREGTINILQDVYKNEEDAKAAYEFHQARWDNKEGSCANWKKGSHRCRL